MSNARMPEAFYKGGKAILSVQAIPYTTNGILIPTAKEVEWMEIPVDHVKFLWKSAVGCTLGVLDDGIHRSYRILQTRQVVSALLEQAFNFGI